MRRSALEVLQSAESEWQRQPEKPDCRWHPVEGQARVCPPAPGSAVAEARLTLERRDHLALRVACRFCAYQK